MDNGSGLRRWCDEYYVSLARCPERIVRRLSDLAIPFLPILDCGNRHCIGLVFRDCRPGAGGRNPCARERGRLITTSSTDASVMKTGYLVSDIHFSCISNTNRDCTYIDDDFSGSMLCFRRRCHRCLRYLLSIQLFFPAYVRYRHSRWTHNCIDTRVSAGISCFEGMHCGLSKG